MEKTHGQWCPFHQTRNLSDRQPVMLLIESQEGNHRVLVDDMRIQNFDVPVLHRRQLVCLQDDVRESLFGMHGRLSFPLVGTTGVSDDRLSAQATRLRWVSRTTPVIALTVTYSLITCQ